MAGGALHHCLGESSYNEGLREVAPSEEVIAGARSRMPVTCFCVSPEVCFPSEKNLFIRTFTVLRSCSSSLQCRLICELYEIVHNQPSGGEEPGLKSACWLSS